MTPNKLLPMFITALCLIVPASLWAQTTEPPLVQRLTWVGDEYATRYEVIIEKEEDGKYKRVLQEFTTNFFIEVSLSSGKYRFQVIPYDFFNLPVPETEWMDFEVRHHEIIMANQDKPESKNEVIAPSPEPEKTIENKNKFDIYLGLAWIPLQPIYSENESFGKNPSPYGAGLRLAIIFVKKDFYNFGMESSTSWHLSPGDQPVHSLSFDLNFVLCFSNDKTSFNYKAGAGVFLRSGESPISDSVLYAFHVNIGLSFIWLPSQHLYLEPGIEYVHSFVDSGFIRPSIVLGYKF